MAQRIERSNDFDQEFFLDVSESGSIGILIGTRNVEKLHFVLEWHIFPAVFDY